MHEPLFTNVEESTSRWTMPLVGQPLYNILLKGVEVREREKSFSEGQDPIVHAGLRWLERLQLAAAIVNHTHRAVEPKLPGPGRNLEGVFGIGDRAAKYRVYGDVKLSIFGQPLQLSIQNLQTFFRNLVRLDIIDADLQIVESRSVQGFNPIWNQQVSICDERSDGAASAGSPYQKVEIGMQGGLATAECNDAGAKRAKLIDAPQHLAGWNRIRVFVEFIAIGTSQVALPDGHNLRKNRVIPRCHGPGEHPRFPPLPMPLHESPHR